MHDSRTLLHTSDIKPHMGILTIYNNLDTNIYQAEGFSWPPQLSDAVRKQVFYLNLNYCKQSNSITVTVHKMLSITHKHMQCSLDGQLQIINYIPLLVAEISFLLLHYPSWGTKFLSLCFTIVNDLSKLYPLQYTRAVQKVSDLNFFRLNKSSTGSVLHCGCGGDIYAHV